jgi:hypothetical protein
MMYRPFLFRGVDPLRNRFREDRVTRLHFFLVGFQDNGKAADEEVIGRLY